MGVKWWGLGAYERESKPGHTISATKMYAVKPGDLVINKIWVRHGSSAIVGAELDGCVVTADFPTFELDKRMVLREWLTYMFKTEWFWTACDVMSRGTSGRQRIDPKAYLEIEIPLPPLDEQRRIVARIDALAGRIAEAQRLQEEALKEAEALWAAGTAQVFHRLENAPRRTIQEICEVRGGLQKQPSRIPRDHPTPYLTVAHVQRNRIDLSIGLRYFEILPQELNQYRLEPGDLLIVEGNGSADQIGRAAVFRGEIENCVHQNHVIRARPNPSLVLSEYLNGYLNSPVGMDEVRRRSRTTSGLLTLSVGRIREIELPIPSLDEQQHAVATLNELQARVDALRRLQESTQAELAALLPAVLDKAFRGEL